MVHRNEQQTGMRKYTLLFALLFCIFRVDAQNAQSFQQSYENGKELFKMERYGLAMQAFKPLISAFNENPYTKPASFHYAVAAYYEKQYDVALSTLTELKTSYPEWKQLDEVNLWLSRVYTEKRDFEKAVEALNDIKNPETSDFANELLLSRLIKTDSYDSLHALYQKHPDNKPVAISLATAIAKKPLPEQDRNLLFELIEKHNLSDEKYGLVEIEKSEKKNSYNIAVLLPFMKSDLMNNRSAIRNQFVIDLYQGMLLAQEELKAMSIKVNLLAYDTKHDEKTTRKILELPELQHVDLIYGPLYPQPVKLASQFSYDYKINIFNPLSANQQVVGNNPYSFLYMPTNETQGRYCAEYLIQNQIAKKTGFVFYGSEEKDSVLAYNFASTFYENGDSSLVLMEIEESRSKKIIEILTEGTKVEIEPPSGNRPAKTKMLYKIPRDSIGFVFIASESPAIASSAITALETREDTVALIGKENWLNSQIISYDALERLNAILIAPTHIHVESDAYRYFKTIYQEKFNALPSKNACIGYETTLLLGKLLSRYGTHFENEFDNKIIRGGVLSHYKLNRKNDNQYVPLVQFKDSELHLLNP